MNQSTVLLRLIFLLPNLFLIVQLNLVMLFFILVFVVNHTNKRIIVTSTLHSTKLGGGLNAGGHVRGGLAFEIVEDDFFSAIAKLVISRRLFREHRNHRRKLLIFAVALGQFFQIVENSALLGRIFVGLPPANQEQSGFPLCRFLAIGAFFQSVGGFRIAHDGQHRQKLPLGGHGLAFGALFDARQLVKERDQLFHWRNDFGGDLLALLRIEQDLRRLKNFAELLAGGAKVVDDLLGGSLVGFFCFVGS